jgi:hypothetical protein
MPPDVPKNPLSHAMVQKSTAAAVEVQSKKVADSAKRLKESTSASLSS